MIKPNRFKAFTDLELKIIACSSGYMSADNDFGDDTVLNAYNPLIEELIEEMETRALPTCWMDLDEELGITPH